MKRKCVKSDFGVDKAVVLCYNSDGNGEKSPYYTI